MRNTAHPDSTVSAAPQRAARDPQLKKQIVIGILSFLLAIALMCGWHCYQVNEERNHIVDTYFDQMPDMVETTSMLTDAYSYCHTITNQYMVIDVANIVSNAYDLRQPTLEKRAALSADLTSLQNTAQVTNLMIITLDGDIYFSSNPERVGQNLVRDGLFTQEELDTLLGPNKKGTMQDVYRGDIGAFTRSIPLEKEMNKVTYQFYSCVLSDKYDPALMLVLADNSEIYNSNLNALLDISGYLKYVSTDQSLTAYTDSHPKESDTAVLFTRSMELDLPNVGKETLYVDVAPPSLHDLQPVFWAFLAMLCVLVMMVCYSIFLRGSSRRKVLQRLLSFAVIGVIVVMMASMYSQTLADVSDAMRTADFDRTELQANLNHNQEITNATQEYYIQKRVTMAKLQAYWLEDMENEITAVRNPAGCYRYMSLTDAGGVRDQEDRFGNPIYAIESQPRLKQLCETNNIGSIAILNTNGQAILSSTDSWYYTIAEDTSGNAESLYDVLMGKKPYYYSSNGDEELLAVPLKLFPYDDGSGVTKYRSYKEYAALLDAAEEGGEAPEMEYGLMITRSSEPAILTLTNNLDLRMMEMCLSCCQQNDIFVLDPSDGSFVDQLNQDLHEDVFTQDEEKSLDGVNRFVTFYDESSLLCLRTIPSMNALVEIFTPNDVVFSYRNQAVLSNGVIALVLLFATALFLSLTVPRDVQEMDPEVAQKRLPGQEVRFGLMRPEEKIGVMAGGCLLMVVTLVTLRIIYAATHHNTSPVLDYILSGRWPKSFNLFSISAVLFIAVAVILGVKVLKKLLSLFSSAMDARYDTVVKLTVSILQYAAGIGLVLVCSGWLGFNTGTVITTAGILTVVVGLGANSIINDVLSGMFQIFEGVYKVGDIITVDGFTGTVINMGLRTTKIARGGEVKTFNNSRISGAVNLTQELTSVPLDLVFSISSTAEDARGVVMERYMPLLGSCPAIVGRLEYKGVQSFSEKTFTVQVVAHCLQADKDSAVQAMKLAQMALFREGAILSGGK